jgi:hypothetical protein
MNLHQNGGRLGMGLGFVGAVVIAAAAFLAKDDSSLASSPQDACGCFSMYDNCLNSCQDNPTCANICENEYNECQNNCGSHGRLPLARPL